MNVLFLTQVLPYPLVGGAKIRAYYMLRTLAQTHNVTLVSFVREDDRPEYVAHLRQFCRQVHVAPMERSRLRDGLALAESVVTGRPAVIVRDRLRVMRRLLARLVREEHFDVVHADQTTMAQYALYARSVSANGRPPRLVLDQHNALHLLVKRQARYERGPARWLWRWEAARLRRYEADLCRRFDRILTVTAEDRQALLGLLPRSEATAVDKRLRVIPICVDPGEQPALQPVAQSGHILHLGTMFWPPNVEGVLWFGQEVLPRVLREAPDACFTIAGKNPPPAVQALADAGSPVAGHVEVTGFVADPQPLLDRSRVFIVPVRAGGGMRVKILDAWQWGLPVVSTTVGAEGIDVRPEENVLLADTPAAFAEAVVRVLRRDEVAERLRRNGRRWVARHYDWRQEYGRVEELYQGLQGAQA